MFLLKRIKNRLFPSNEIEKPMGEIGIEQLGHRQYVGGMWEEIGELQFNFLKSKGLTKKDYLLDIACGSLRGGVHFIRFLNPGHYIGLDKESLLIEKGINNELGSSDFEKYNPQFIISNDFNFSTVKYQPTYAIAQSLFTHLPASLIRLCLTNLKTHIHPDGKFYATFFEVSQKEKNPSKAHDHKRFAYTKDEMINFGEQTGWLSSYVGDWNHPRGQKMMVYQPN